MAIITIGKFHAAFDRLLNFSKIKITRLDSISELADAKSDDNVLEGINKQLSETDLAVISQDVNLDPSVVENSNNIVHLAQIVRHLGLEGAGQSGTPLPEQDWYEAAREVLRFHGRLQISSADRIQMESAREQANKKFSELPDEGTFYTQHPQFQQYVRVYRPKTASKRITFFFNGAIDPERANGRPVFQRTSFFPDIEGTCVSIPDPTQDAFRELKLGWGQGTPEVWGIATQVGVVEGIVEGWLKLNNLNRDQALVQFHGSSAGGFQALMVGTFVRADRVLANNPQVDVLHYESLAAKKTMATSVYGELAAKDGEIEEVLGLNAPTDVYMRQNWNRRLSLVALWSRTGYAPRSWLLVNSQSSTDVQLQMKPLLSFLSGSPGLNLLPEVRLEMYASPERQHNPIGQQPTIHWINSPAQAIS